MSTPIHPIPRRFYRAAYQRFAEAAVLFDAEYYLGAIYLAGYTVECILKALILAATPASQHTRVEAEFRGQRGHDYAWLRHRYNQTQAPSWPPAIRRSLMFVGTWAPALRYVPGLGNRRDAERFLAEAQHILT